MIMANYDAVIIGGGPRVTSVDCHLPGPAQESSCGSEKEHFRVSTSENPCFPTIFTFPELFREMGIIDGLNRPVY